LENLGAILPERRRTSQPYGLAIDPHRPGRHFIIAVSGLAVASPSTLRSPYRRPLAGVIHTLALRSDMQAGQHGGARRMGAAYHGCAFPRNAVKGGEYG
jgi:hypothetical protein